MKLVYFDDFKVGVVKGENVVDVTSLVSGLPASGAREPMIALIENRQIRPANPERRHPRGLNAR